MSTLSDLTRLTARLISPTIIGAATATEVVDTQLTDTVNLAGFPDDHFNNGTVWITSGTQAGKTRKITDFSDANDRIIFPALGGVIASGVTYEVAMGHLHSYNDLKQAVNSALKYDIGYIIDTDETLTTLNGKLFYTLPAGVSKVRAVKIVHNIGTDEEFETPSHHVDEREGELVFDQEYEPEGGLTLRLIYEKFHDDLVIDSDTLSASVDVNYLVHLAARQAWRLAYMQYGKARDEVPEWLNEAISNLAGKARRNIGNPRVRVHSA